ncbi:unnamed protein product [Ectocarpus sp. 12 AP-2014]
MTTRCVTDMISSLNIHYIRNHGAFLVAICVMLHAGSMAPAGLGAGVRGCAVTVKLGESDMSDDEKEEHCTTHSTKDRGEEHDSSHDGQVIPQIGGIQVKEEDEEKASSGKRKLGGIAKTLRRNNARTAGSRPPNYADSPIRASSKRQRKASAPGPMGGGTAATHETAPRPTARYGQGRRCCQEHDCTTRPSYGEAHSKKVETCSRHAKPGMVLVFGKKCGHPECTKRPSYGFAGSKKAEFCAQHAKPGMVHVHGRRCGHSECTKHPSYGKEGSKRAEFCAQHAKPGMVHVHSRRCGHPECRKHPSYGIEGSRKAEFCAQHAKPGMIHVLGKKCGKPECTKQPSYGIAGSKKAEFCVHHSERGMINVRRVSHRV